jgi:uncharacterized membrane protein YeaQ/YmgE (transglycosylase-associated protein family)
MGILEIMGWALFGLVIGAIARLLYPGPNPMGIFLTMILGIVGSLVGGLVSSLLFQQDPANPGFHPAGLIGSTIGAVIALVLYLRTTARAA